MQLNEKISFLRKKSGLSQQNLAERLDVSRQTVSKWEMGVVLPSTEKLIGLSKAFGIPMDVLIDDQRPAEEPGGPAPAAAERDLPGWPAGQGYKIAVQMMLSILALALVTFFAFDFVQNALSARKVCFWGYLLLPELSAILQIVGCAVLGFLFGRKYGHKKPSAGRACLWTILAVALLYCTFVWCVLYQHPFGSFRASVTDQMYAQSVLMQFFVAKVASPAIAPTFLFCEAFYWLGALGIFKKRKKAG